MPPTTTAEPPMRATGTARVSEDPAIDLAYETFGDRNDPPVLLIAGLGAQMLAWPDELCSGLAARGAFVVRFDNRDVGHSTRLETAPVPNLVLAVLRRHLGLAGSAPYTLSDMARDAVGLLDALGLESAHVVGCSMGGMIAQALTIEHPHRARSLTSIMSSCGDPSLPLPPAWVQLRMLQTAPRERTELIDWIVDCSRDLGSAGYHDPIEARRVAESVVERGWYPEGTSRQLHAVLAATDRTEALRALDVPATIVHGALDALLPLAHGEATARAIRGAELHLVEDLGHDLPTPLHPRFVEAIAKTVERGESGRRSVSELATDAAHAA